MKTQLTPNQLAEMARHKAVTVPQDANPNTTPLGTPADRYALGQSKATVDTGTILLVGTGLTASAIAYWASKKQPPVAEAPMPQAPVSQALPRTVPQAGYSPPHPRVNRLQMSRQKAVPPAEIQFVSAVPQPTAEDKELARLYAEAIPHLSEADRTTLRTSAAEIIRMQRSGVTWISLPDLAAIRGLQDLPAETQLEVFSSLFSRFQSLGDQEKASHREHNSGSRLPLEEHSLSLILPATFLIWEGQRLRTTAHSLTEILLSRTNDFPRDRLFNASILMRLDIDRHVRAEGITASLLSPDFIQDVKGHAGVGEAEVVRAVQHYLLNQAPKKGERSLYLDLFLQSVRGPFTEGEQTRIESIAREFGIPIAGDENALQLLRERLALLDVLLPELPLAEMSRPAFESALDRNRTHAEVLKEVTAPNWRADCRAAAERERSEDREEREAFEMRRRRGR